MLSIVLVGVMGLQSAGSAYALLASWSPRWPRSLRLTATVLVGLWIMQAAFLLLSIPGWFRLLPALVLLTAVAVGVLAVVSVEAVRDVLRSDLGAVADTWRETGVFLRILLVAGASLLGSVVVRSLVTPPLAWDDMTYHLFRAGTWASAGGFTSQPAPDAWTYYDYYPGGGEILHAWGFLGSPSGGLVVVVSAAVLLALGLAVYSAARAMGQDRAPSLLAALAVCTVPAAFGLVDSAYVDNQQAFLLLAAFVMLARYHHHDEVGAAVLGLVALATAAGVKHSSAAFVGIGVIWLVVSSVRHLRARRHRAGVAPGRTLLVGGLLLLAILPSSFWYGRAALEQGSPLYPMSVSLGPIDIAGNAQLDRVLDGSWMDPPVVVHGLADHLDWLSLLFRLGSLDLNYQPVGFLYLPLALGGVVVAWRRLRLRAETAVLVLFAATSLQLLALDQTEGLRTAWATTTGRLVLSSFAAVVVLAICLRSLGSVSLLPLWYAIVLAQLAVSSRGLWRSWSAVDNRALWSLLGAVAPWVLVGGAFGFAVVLAVGGRRRSLGVLVLAAALLVGFAVRWESTRRDLRADYYDGAATGDVFRVHPVGFRCALPLAQAVDDPGGSVVAVSTGWLEHDVGQWNARYPFLGSSLQNVVEYVPVTSSGEVVDYSELDRLGSEIDGDAWLDRLDDRDVDFVVLLDPLPPEQDLIERDASRFELAASGCDDSVVYRFVG